LTDKYYIFSQNITSKSKNRFKNSFPFFHRGKWCKDKSSFLNHQIFKELFLQFLNLFVSPVSEFPLENPFQCISQRFCSQLRVQRYRQFYILQIFPDIFSYFF